MVEKHPHSDLIDRPVTAIMSSPVYSVTEDVALSYVLAAMVHTGRRHLAVVDVAGHCRGVVGDRAIAAAWARDPASMAYEPVRNVLDEGPTLVGPEATVGDVALRMHIDAVDAVVVVNRTGHPMGMVTGGDLVDLIASAATEPVSSAL